MTRASINPMKRLLVGGVGAALLAAGCSGDPALFLGGPAGPTVAIQLSTNRFILRAAESATIGAQARDEEGNPTADAVSFTACDAKVTVASGESTTQWAQVATVTGVALGESCVAATVGGMADTIRVAIGPGSMVIVGPDTVRSGEAAQYELTFFDLSGNPLTPAADFEIPEVVTLNALRLPLTAVDELNYDAAGQQPGNVTLQTTTSADFAAVTANKTVTIVPGVFAGTLSANTAAQGGAIVVTPAAGMTWDGDEYVLINGKPGSNWSGVTGAAVTNPTSGTLTFRVPWNVAPGTYDVTVVNQGAGQLAQVTTGFTVTAGTVVHNQQTPRASLSGEWRDKISLDRPLAFPVVFDPAATGLTGTNSVVSYYKITQPSTPSGNAYELVLRLTLDWVDSCGATCGTSVDEDFDIEIIDGGFTAFLDTDGATLAKPEVTHFNFQENRNYIIRYRTYSGAGGSHAVVEWLGDGSLCSDEAACRIGGKL